MTRTIHGFGVSSPLCALIVVTLCASSVNASTQDASNELIKRGEKVFAAVCSSCHGDGGNGHNAPRLVDRGLAAQRIKDVITSGVKGTAMVAWGPLLSAQDYNGVIAYVDNLNGIGDAASSGARPIMSAEIVEGRDLFRDPTRELGACSNCHAVGGRGIDIVPIKNIPQGAADLRGLATQQIRTATINGESFPALVVLESPNLTKLYDFTTVPPVLRTFTSSVGTLVDGTKWRHGDVLGTTYSDRELNLLLGYVRAVGKP